MPDLAERYRDNLARHLVGISRDLQTRVHEGLVARGHGSLRPSFGPLLSAVREEGRTLNALADELGVTCQAISQLVNAAQAAGYLARRRHPTDGRSKLVVPTRQGRALIEHGVDAVLSIEEGYRQRVGPSAYRALTSSLAALYADLKLPRRSDPALTARARGTIGVLPSIVLRMERDLMVAARARGHRGLKMVFSQVIPLIGPEGARVHEIAREHRVSRQAISAIVRELTALGYLERRPDPRDGRGVVFVFTQAGVALIRDSVEAFQAVERHCRSLIGARPFAQLEQVAGDLYRSLHLEAEIFGSDPESGGQRDVRALASRLRDRLGPGDTERLAALLGTPSEGGVR